MIRRFEPGEPGLSFVNVLLSTKDVDDGFSGGRT